MRGHVGFQAGLLRGPQGLQAVIARKDQAGRAGEGPGIHAVGEPLGHEGGAGGGTVTQGTERERVAALQGASDGGDSGGNLSAAEPVLCDILIINDQIELKSGDGGEGGDDPGGKAVGVHSDAQGGGGVVTVGQAVFQAGLEQSDLCQMGNQAQAGGGGAAGLAADDQQGTGAFLKRLDALGNGGGGQAKVGCGKVKAATAVDGGEGSKLGVVEHRGPVMGWVKIRDIHAV